MQALLERRVPLACRSRPTSRCTSMRFPSLLHNIADALFQTTQDTHRGLCGARTYVQHRCIRRRERRGVLQSFVSEYGARARNVGVRLS